LQIAEIIMLKLELNRVLWKEKTLEATQWFQIKRIPRYVMFSVVVVVPKAVYPGRHVRTFGSSKSIRVRERGNSLTTANLTSQLPIVMLLRKARLWQSDLDTAFMN
jgi:hypothetical protein